VPLLPCQIDSYRQSNRAAVRSCEPAGESTFDVVLSESVLYPEGGGQPSDGGTVGGLPVMSLRTRSDGAVVHTLGGAVSGEVEVTVDWSRRYDHMQQHTSQHLLTAIAQDRFGLATTAFHLGAERCDIELDGMLSAADLTALEAAVNAEVRAARPVATKLARPDELAALGVRTRGLPEGFQGDVRLVSIEGIDLNTCGGTHAANTAELQALKLTGTEPMRGGTRLFYLAGGRVLGALDGALGRERALSRLLTCPAAEHADAVARVMAGAKSAGKEKKGLLSELAGLIGRELAASGTAHLHRPAGDMGFLSAVAGAAGRAKPGLTVLLTAGSQEGVFLLIGPPDRVSALGPRIAEVLGGRGGGARGRFQGKGSRLDRAAEAAALLA